MRHLLSFLPALLLACTATGEDVSQSDDALEGASSAWLPYPTEIRKDLHPVDGMVLGSASVADFSSPARDQGALGACASFSFAGLLESHLYTERGITIDLSERFVLYSNLLQTGTIGKDVDVIRQLPDLTGRLGVMPESSYPYASVTANVDAIRGSTFASALRATTASSPERSAVLERSEFFGALPSGPYPVKLPLLARVGERAKVPSVRAPDGYYRCFSNEPELEPRLDVTPREALALCFDFEPTEFYSCDFDVTQAAAEARPNMPETDDQCTYMDAMVDALSKAQYEKNRDLIELTIGTLDQGEAVMLGVTAPTQLKDPVWTSSHEPLGGHAVLAVGYVTADDLSDANAQSRGILGNGIFDVLAGLDPYRLHAEPSVSAKIEARKTSDLGQRLLREGGLILFRNSWGTGVGVEGHQAMTFDYFAQHGTHLLARQNRQLDGKVTWAGDRTCPANRSLHNTGDWGRRPTNAAVRARYVASHYPPSCKKQDP